MNPYLTQLQPYPFEKLKVLFQGATPPKDVAAISFGIGEPQHATPSFIKEAMIAGLDGLSLYPATAGSSLLRETIARWLQQRYGLLSIDSETEILPVNGSREALFAFAQTVIDANQKSSAEAYVVCPNPFYQIYEGAALLAGAQPYFANCLNPENGFSPDYASIPEAIWSKTQLLYVCSPGNPTGSVLTLDEWKTLFDLSEKYGFVIASDECYSEIYLEETHPPLGGLQAAQELGRGYERLVVFSSLSKRSNVPGLRSGFVAGDALLLKQFLRYRTYHGCAMSPVVQAASIAAWRDEAHVRDNRAAYAKKFTDITPMLAKVLDVQVPHAGFYLWARIGAALGLSDTEFARALFEKHHVTVLPGSYLARQHAGCNPGENYLRIALVAPYETCLEGAERIIQFCQQPH